MELEHVLPEIRRYTDGEKVRDVCRRFANVLTDKMWERGDTLEARIQREFKRLVTIREPIGDSGVLTTEKAITVSADFKAEREQIGFDEALQKAEYEEVFTMSALLREQVRPDELPAWVLEELSEKLLFKPDDEADVAAVLPESPVSLNALYAFDFEKVSEVEYVINEEGGIENYSVTCRYLYDDQFIGERSYSWDDDMVEYVTSVVDSHAQEAYKASDTPLTEEDIDQFQRTFDQAIATLQFDRFEQDDTEDGIYVTEDTHCRRALGMIALNAKRFIGMRIK